MANSSLATYIWTGSKANCNVRDHVIDTITIHHMAGNGSCEGCCRTLAYKADPGSVNYCIDSNGVIGVMIDEDKRAWTSSNRANDMRAVTMEVANDKPSDAGGWHVSDKALASVINLCVDICRRHGKTKMIWCGSLNATNARKFASNEMRMTIHKWFAATGCPGAYLESKMGYIATEVTNRLNGGTSVNSTSPTPTKKKTVDEIAKEVIAGKWSAGKDRITKLKAAGYNPDAVQNRVDELMGKTKPKPAKKKSIDEIAKEVIAGKWSSGITRQKKLTEAGYNYNEVQRRVEELISKVMKKSIDTVAKEVIRGDWGSGTERRQRLTKAGYNYDVVQARVEQLLKK